MITDEPASELYAPFLSSWLRGQIRAGALRCGQAYSLTATVLHADMRGFSGLTTAFAALPEGAEQLHEALNETLTLLTSVATAYEGDVLAIAGDAITVWWPELIDTERAARCGSAMQAALATATPIVTPRGTLQPLIRVGIAAGRLTALLAGLPAYGVHLVLDGLPLHAAVAAEQASATGQVHVVAGVLEGAPPVDSAYAGMDLRLSFEHFLHPSFAERLRIGALVAEYRRCVPAFASFTTPTSLKNLHELVGQAQVVVDRWGGWLNEIEIGDKGALFVLLFGAPVSSGDDQVRAVGCCIELIERGLAVRAGVSTGTLFVGAVGSPLRRVYTAQGDEMNLAAHLMHRAEPGSVWVTGRVRDAIAGHYAAHELEPQLVKGHDEPIPVARAVPARLRSGGGWGGLSYPPGDAAYLPGREREMALMEAAAEDVYAGQARILIVEGESGIGKSALVSALISHWTRLRQPSCWSDCRGGLVGPLAPWRSIIAELSGIDQTAAPAGQARRLATVLAEAAPDMAPTVGGELWQLLTYLLGLDDHAEGVYTRDAGSAVVSDTLIEIAARLLLQRITRGPLLIALENIHRVDEASLRLAERLAAMAWDPPHSYPLLLVLSLRPLDEDAASLRNLRNHPGAIALQLGPLSTEASSQLLRTLLRVEHLPPRLFQLVERYAQGQPLFIREYLRALRERRLLTVEAGTVVIRGDLEQVSLPDTIQAIIQARVDRLDEATRLTLKLAAVIGKTFPLSLLRAIHPAAPDQPLLAGHMATLTSLQILQLELADPEPVYRFRHSVTHEVAYASVLFRQRRELHLAAAGWYEQIYAADLQRDAAPAAVYQLLATHYGRAEAWPAYVHACRMVAEHAIRTYANRVALDYLAAALAHTTDPTDRYELLALRDVVSIRTGAHNQRRDDIMVRRTLARQLRDPIRLARAGYCEARTLCDAGAYDEAFAMVRRAGVLLAATEIQALPWAYVLHAALLDLEGEILAMQGSHAAAHPLHEQALRELRNRCSRNNGTEPAHRWPELLPASVEAHTLNNLGLACAMAGDHNRALHAHQAAFTVANHAGDQIEAGRAITRMAIAEQAVGSMPAALQHGEQAIRIAHATGDRVGLAMALRALAITHLTTHDYEQARSCLSYAMAAAAGAGALALEDSLNEDMAALDARTV